MSLNKNACPLLFATSLFLSTLLYVFILFVSSDIGIFIADKYLAAALFSALYFVLLVFFIKDNRDDLLNFLFVSAVTAALVIVRVSMLSHEARDYSVFLSDWIYQMRQMSGAEPLVQKIGDYNMPYLYFLFIISKLKLNDLILIKWFSCVFDFIAALFVMKIVSLKTKNKMVVFSSFALTLGLPTLLLNSSYWGQCDSILAALCIGAVYFFLKDKPALAIVFYTLAFSFKLQAIFMLPFIIVLCILKRVAPFKLLLFPAVFLLTLLPALIAGRPFIDCVRIYFDQAEQYPVMSLNSPSFWQIFEQAPIENFNLCAVMLTGVAFISYIYIAYRFKDKLFLPEQVELAYISAVIIPFLLPRMHDRYFFIADILSVCVFIYDKKKWYVPLVTQLASLNCYSYYLFGGNLLFPYSYATISLLVAIIVSTYSLVKRLNQKSLA